jgi:hypothetical protein
MNSTMLAGLSLIDATGLSILAATAITLLLGITANLWLRGRYAAIEKEVRHAQADVGFATPVLRHIVSDAADAAAGGGDVNSQAIIENCFHTDLRAMLLAERFLRGATGLVIILGLLGTFYGLTLSIGKIVHLVATETGAGTDIAQGVSQGLTQALSGMAVAFSNSLVGILSAVILTVVGILSNISDRRSAVMVQIETYLDRVLPKRAAAISGSPDGLGQTVAVLGNAIVRFEAALQSFATTTKDFHEFNAHLKDNVQRLSLTFADVRDSLKAQMLSTGPTRKI